jgi:predicted nucleotidyltransferase
MMGYQQQKGEIITPVIGIIAEFNPLHNGHQHLIRSVQEMHPASAIVCVMSGNFVQRGEAAICNKWVRARMALDAGVDLVVELPFCWAVRSAYFFARGAIQMLGSTGVVTHLAFGSEAGTLAPLQSIARLMANETDLYKQELRSQLARGLSFPASRARAIQAALGTQIDRLDELVMQPNNILALEYLRVLTEESLPIEPLTIPRQGPGYHQDQLNNYASASAIRHYLETHPADSQLEDTMPKAALNLLRQEIATGRAPIYTDGLGIVILTMLRTTPLERLGQIYEINEGLENRIRAAAYTSGCLAELKQAIKSKRYNSTRINRILLYTLLSLKTSQILGFDQTGPQYLHILGLSTKGRKILQDIKNKSSLRVLNTGSEVKAAWADNLVFPLQSMLELDIKASDVYTLLYPSTAARRGASDFTTSPVLLSSP